MIQIENLTIDGQTFTGVEIDLEPAPLLIIRGERGFLMCGYLNIEAANKLGSAAASISGVKTLNDLLDKEVTRISTKASELGVKEGMNGREALKFL